MNDIYLLSRDNEKEVNLDRLYMIEELMADDDDYEDIKNILKRSFKKES